LRIEKTRTRRGDNAQLARVSFVDDLKEAPVAQAAKEEAKPEAKAKTAPTAKKAPAKEKK
jgi:hypothetical protein